MMKKLVGVIVLLLMATTSYGQETNCQYRKMTLNDVTSGPTVIHVRTTRGIEVREFGFHESGIYPWEVEYQWCGSGWTVEYRLGSVCTFWNGTYMDRRKTSNGKKQEPCVWSTWQVAEFDTQARPNPPVILAQVTWDIGEPT